MALDYKVLGERIKKARKVKHVSQKELAKEIGVSIAYLSRIERGTSQINLKRVTQISEILDVSVGELLTGISERSEEYLIEEFADILKKCSPEKQRLILNISKIIVSMKEE